MNAQLGSIHAQHLFCPGKACIQGKGTGMGKAVQHLRVFRQALDSQTVVFLIQEEAGLLAVFDIHLVADAVFHNLHLGVKLRSDETFSLLHTFFFALFGIASLVDAADDHAVLRQHFLDEAHQVLFHPVNTQRQGLNHDHIGKLVHHKSRQEICLTENQAAA